MIFGAIGKNSIIKKLNIVENPKNIFIGNNVVIRSYAWLAATPLINQSACKLIVNNNTYIGNNAHIYATKRIEICENVLIADRVYISDNTHGYFNILIPIKEQPIQQLQTVTISEGAWLGENVCIIGANIGKNSIVAANSVVTKNVPDYCMAAGSPAKIIKRFCQLKNMWLKTNELGEII